ncbi:M14 family metallopeptidase [Candidatus Solirubrobacter pratensis]|uniref:M14 family zinc carboxypeptidase n=1 Tax=Candidatus Solirubrobacter pratensis TaxID=1298857 RepID=UPI0003FC0943|nr:M14 family zinc carboxypeptidase [Candidatus Solirubrobacter pratensis]
MIRRCGAALLLVAAALVAAPGAAKADVDPAGCTDTLQYDPSIPKYSDYMGLPLGGGATGTASRRPTADLYKYLDALTQATATNPRVRIVQKFMSETALQDPANRQKDKQVWYAVIGTPENIANLDAGRADGPFWAGVREGTVSEAEGLAAVRERPVFGWVTATPHGNEPAAGEASLRLLYEMAARMDCANARRLANMDTFVAPVTNPNGRDNNQRTTAWGFDPNRDRGTRNNVENYGFTDAISKYPGVFVIDAHQQSSGYFFPPNEDPVHHEISNFALDFIQNDIGPMLQRMFNDQSSNYQNYNRYDLFTPEYGDTVPALLDGAAGMTYEKGSSENYGKQVYDHYLAMDATVNVTSDQKVQLLTDWVKQWPEAVQQGAQCQLQPNKLVSPLHNVVTQQPDVNVCGYFFKPDLHSGDAAKLIKDLQTVGVDVYRLNTDVNAGGVHTFGPKGSHPETMPAGTIWVPMNQGNKHWIQAILGENPFIPFPYYYDVVTWSYSLMRGQSGNGFLTSPMPEGVSMTPITDPDYGKVANTGKPVYAFNTDSAAGISLAIDLLAKGVSVSRSAAAFDAAGRHFDSGTALADAGTLGGADLAALAKARETPVYGIDGYPAQRYPLATPKIGLYTAGATVPTNPIDRGTGSGECPSASTTFCEAYFVLTQKQKLPPSVIKPVTSADLTAGRLVNEGFTAFIHSGVTGSANTVNANAISGPAATAVQDFVNRGGRFIATTSSGLLSARNAGVTAVSSDSVPTLNTPGSTFDGQFDTSNPLVWGFDSGGWFYRSVSADPLYNNNSLAGNGTTIPPAVPAGKYPAQMTTSYGYEVNATAPGSLPGRPALIDQPFGAGHTFLFGFNPFFRAWSDQEERFVLNGVLYPTGAPVGAAAGPAAVAESRTEPVAAPEARAALPQVKLRPIKTTTIDRDVRIKVRRSDAAKLRAAVKKAHLPKKWAKKVKWVGARSSLTLVIKGVRTSDEHTRQMYVSRIIGRLDAGGVRALQAQL